MIERDSSKSYHSTSRLRGRRTTTRRISSGRVRAGFLLGAYFTVLCVVMGVGGKPLPLKPGEPVPYDIRSRLSYRYIDHDRWLAARETAMDQEPRTYTIKPVWLQEVMSSLSKVLSEVKEAGTENEASDALKLDDINLEIDPLWRLRQDRGINALVDMEQRVENVLKTMAEEGIMDDLVCAEELHNNHTFIKVKEDEETRTVPLSKDNGISEVRRLLAQVIATLHNYPDDVRGIVNDCLKDEVVPNLEYSERETTKNRQAAAERVRRIYTQVNKGEMLARKGVTLTLSAFRKILEEERAYREARNWYQVLMQFCGLVVVTGALLIITVLIIRRSEPQRKMTTRRWLVLGMFFLLAVAGARLVGFYLHQENLAPLALVTLPVGMIFSLATATVVALIGSILITVAVGADLGFTLSMATATLVGILLVRDIRRRSSILQTGAFMGAVWFIVYFAYRLLACQETLIPSVIEASYGLVNGLVTGAVIAGLMPFIEYAFKATTNISLLELSDQNHPALRDLLIRAPGTYHHSLIVGNIAEAASRAAGADPLLARVSSYYHDIGKMTKPEYFVENQPPGRSPHDGLSPSMSALVIISHVKDGTDLATEYSLPDVIVDIIRQHHGTMLVEFFFRRAQETGEDKDKNMSERLFHYPGPLPESREAAIVMVADSVEAASRSLSDPSPTHIDNLVGTIIHRRLMEGQFDQSGLMFRDLTVIRESIVRVLVSMFHSRPRYPGQTA